MNSTTAKLAKWRVRVLVPKVFGFSFAARGGMLVGEIKDSVFQGSRAYVNGVASGVGVAVLGCYATLESGEVKFNVSPGVRVCTSGEPSSVSGKLGHQCCVGRSAHRRFHVGSGVGGDLGCGSAMRVCRCLGGRRAQV